MSVFDNLRTKLLTNFSDWIQVTDYESNWTIENVPMIQDKGVDENAIKSHCVGCVIANQCWFKDEKNGRRYNRETGFMIYPNGKIKNTTIVGRKW